MHVRISPVMKNRMKLIIGICVSAVVFLVGCGGGSDNGESAAYTDDGRRIIEVQGNDQMRFNVSEIRVNAGEPLQVTFHNVGRMPKESMGHNWVLFEQMSDSDLNRIAMEAARRSPDYLPDDRSSIIVHTEILGPGESETLEFDAPSEPGTYVFACTFPGHFAIMKGNMIVE